MNVQVGNYTVYNDTLLGADDTFENNDQFMVRRVTNNSTRLWFPANLNYTGYTVRCIDDDNDDNDVMACMNLQVTGKPPPHNLMLISFRSDSQDLPQCPRALPSILALSIAPQ